MPSPSSTSTRLETAAIIVDHQDRTLRSPAERYTAGRRLGVTSDVRQRLARHLHDVGRDRGELGGDPRVDVHDRDDSGALLELRAELTQRLIELTIGEDARP